MVTVKSNPTRKPSYTLECEKDGWIQPPSGQISRHWKNPLSATWILSMVESPASLTQSQVKENVRKMPETYGLTPIGYLGMYDQDSSSWKTYQASLLDLGKVLPSLGESLMTLPESGMSSDGHMLQLKKWAHPTEEKGSSSWPTPDANPSTYSNGFMGKNLRQAAADFLPIQKIASNGNLSLSDTHSSRQQLNPTFVEGLMGLPLGWTSIEESVWKDSVMESFHNKQYKHG